VEFLVDMVTTVPDGTSEDEVADMRKREAGRAAELAAQGNLLRLWRPPLAPGEWHTWGLFSAEDADQLDAVLASMPLRACRPALAGRGGLVRQPLIRPHRPSGNQSDRAPRSTRRWAGHIT
jgi:muconolactone D-isomerase